MFDVIAYRVYRNRRTIVLGLIPALATLAAIAQYITPPSTLLIAIGLGLPAIHAVRYPNNWSETLTVSLVTSVCIALATTIPADMASGALFMRIFWLIFLWFVLFFVMVSPLAMLATLGPVSERPVCASATSRLNREALRAALTFYPGRSDYRIQCGEADEEGRFQVTMRQEFDVLECDEQPPEVREAGIDENGVLETMGSAVIHSTGPDHHEIFFFDESLETVIVSRHSFIDLGPKGTRVILEEAGTPLTLGMRVGMWLSDFLADYLTDYIDQAEGRKIRANRAFRHKQLVVDLANILLPILNAQGLEPPKDDSGRFHDEK